MNFRRHSRSMFTSCLFAGLAILGAACADPAFEPSAGEDLAVGVSALYPLTTSIWPAASIPVCWENGGAGTAQAQGWTQAAVTAAWSAASGVSFTGWGNCVAGAKGVRIRIDDSNPRAMRLGKSLDGLVDGMYLNFTFNNWSPVCHGQEQHCIEVIAVHEFGHALGFAHEQNRPDTPASCPDAPQGTNGDLMVGAWDAASIMDYCPPGQWGSNAQLSQGDKKGTQMLYGLLANPDGSKGDLSGWTITANGGNGWAVGGDFVTSYSWDSRTQVIDLWAHGFDQLSLSSAPPIEVSEQFSKTYCADSYYLKVQLLDGNMNVVSTYDTGTLSTGGACDWSTNWQTKSTVFSGYGSNVRYIRWEDGGKDSEYWAGSYGARMNNAVLKIKDVGPLRYGSTYNLRNGYSGFSGGYLDTRNAGCADNDLCVSTAYSTNRDQGSGQWTILSASGKAPGSPVMQGDSVYLANRYPYLVSVGPVAGAFGGYLDTRGRGCADNDLCVSTSGSQDRDSGSGTWTIAAGDGAGMELWAGEPVTLLNHYSNGGYLDTRARGCEGNNLCVSTAYSSNRDSGSGTWLLTPAP